jgi:hypothetical protein
MKKVSKIKNYTSDVGVDKSLWIIKKRLVGAGASHIAEFYNEEEHSLEGILFQIKVNGNYVTYKLPSSVNDVRDYFLSAIKKEHRGTRERVVEQALKTAWKLLADWVDIQISMIEVGKKDFQELFFQYAYSQVKDKTVYEMLQNNYINNLLEEHK